MAAKKAAAGLAVVGIGAILLYALSAQAEEPKPEAKPETGGPKPLPQPGQCVRTRPGEKGEAVRAWQRCLIDAGCLAKGEDDGIHGPITEEASNNFASGVPCATPLKTPGRDGGKPAASAKTRVYYLTLEQTAQPSASLATVQAIAGTQTVNQAKSELKNYATDWMKSPENFKRNPDGIFYVYSSRYDNQTADVKSHGSFQITTVA